MAVQGKLLLVAISLLGNLISRLQDNSAIIDTARIQKQYGPVEELVIGVLEEAKVLFTTGVPELGVPVLDPFILDSLPLNLDMPGVMTVGLNISGGILTGLSNFTVSDLKIKIPTEGFLPFSVDMEITFNNVEFVSNYAIDGSIPGLMDELGGEGLFATQIEAFKIRITVATGNYCNVVILDKFSIGLNMKSAYILLTGFLGDEELSQEISQTLTFLVPEIINDNSEALNSLIAPEVRKTVNKVLAFLLFEAPESN